MRPQEPHHEQPQVELVLTAKLQHRREQEGCLMAGAERQRQALQAGFRKAGVLGMNQIEIAIGAKREGVQGKEVRRPQPATDQPGILRRSRPYQPAAG